MKESTSKEKLLKKVRSALIEKQPGLYDIVEVEPSVFEKSGIEFPEVEFAEAFSRMGGQFIFIESYEELVSQINGLLMELNVHYLFCPDESLHALVLSPQTEIILHPDELARCQASLTLCEVLVSRFGSIVMSSRVAGGRAGYSFPPIHIVLASPKQIVPDIKEAFISIRKKYFGNLPSMVTFVSGPSRTADIEKTLVLGAHGPAALYLLLTDFK